ncbi:MAG: helix-turn-helix domain-containing protein [Candidatus Hydrogenedentes bacterium]|nr:helix-turn-helix domain-containing protein [Candidatus Hydrogenedentota bacterium]
MSALAFLRSGEVMAALARAAAAAGTPASVHYVQRNQEGPRLYGWGQCAACRHVHEEAGGARACRLSRTTAASLAQRQDRPMPFVCHMGFACVSVPLIPGEGYMLTLGPYCPMEEQRSLEDDVRAGLASLLEAPVDALPFALDDIHRPPSASVPAIAEWTLDSLRAAWAKWNANEPEAALPVPEPTAPEKDSGKAARSGAARRERPDRESETAAAIAAALAAGSRRDARALLMGAIAETPGRGRAALDARRARVSALASAALEAVARAGLPTASAWEAYPDFSAAVARAETDGGLADAALDLFGWLRRGDARGAVETRLPDYPELFELVRDRLVAGITLEEVAAKLGQTPSAISHRLKRKFGMSFSGYVGRLRVERSKPLLRETKLGIADVGRRVGISDPSNFARLFRKVEGMSPAAYRERFGKQ